MTEDTYEPGGAPLSDSDKKLRLFIYQFTVDRGRCPSLLEMADEMGRAPLAVEGALQRLEKEHSAVVLSPGSTNLWLADPFAALPTPYPVTKGDRSWFGMCAWDALGILAIVDGGEAPLRCPVSNEPFTLSVRDGRLEQGGGVVHFAVPASAWWRDIGFT